MYYEDQSRRFNLVSGLLSGAVLGAGVALLLRPVDRGPVERVRRTAGRVGRTASRRWEELGDDLRDTVRTSVRAGRSRLGS